MKKKVSLGKLRRQKSIFTQMSNTHHLCELLNIEQYKLQLLSLNPKYRIFSIPKKSGKVRWIEDPLQPLKTIQKQLNKYLQAVYFFHKSDAAFGFVKSCKKDPDPRNILTHAQQHLSCQYLVNIDLQDFFHMVTASMVEEIFKHPPFHFEHELVIMLSNICCHQGRLPMGASTSPVLANFAAHKMDLELLDFAKWSGMTYTRFADDMSFSADLEITTIAVEQIYSIITANQFEVNKDKFRTFSQQEVKIITGLQVSDQVKLSDTFFAGLTTEIDRLEKSYDLVFQYRKEPNKWLKKHKQKVQGVLSFAQMILGHSNARLLACEEKYESAILPRILDDVGSFSWYKFPYS